MKLSKHPNPNLRAEHYWKPEDIPFTTQQEKSDKTKSNRKSKKYKT